ncbi:MAG: T9SS type A sorting domain-containing protein [Bacteroidia bacterium]
MKKIILVFFLCIAGLVQAQQSVPNGNFETWNSSPFENPRYYPGTSNRDVWRDGLPFNVEKVADAYHGSYAVKLTTVANASNSSFAYIASGNPDQDPDQWHGGIAYNQKPTGIQGYYKSNVMAGDTAVILITFSKNGVNIGAYYYQIYGQHTAYTPFSLTFSPALTQTPDSFMFAAASSNATSNTPGVAGSMLQLDSISLTGVTVQPAQLNGDFELWDAFVAEVPANWYTREGREITNVKTTTAHKGAFAVKLTTVLSDDENQPLKARPDYVSTGYYPQNCNQCNEEGGFPYTRMADTLVFWYKYTPAGNSKGEASVKFKKNGAIVGGYTIQLDAAATYTKMEMPLMASVTPDTLIVGFQSARWDDSLITQVGSVLYLDEVQLKSQPLNTGIGKAKHNNMLSVYPNPAHHEINITSPEPVSEGVVTLFNLTGQVVLTAPLEGTQTTLNISSLPQGVYLYRLTANGNTLQTGKLQVH